MLELLGGRFGIWNPNFGKSAGAAKQRQGCFDPLEDCDHSCIPGRPEQTHASAHLTQQQLKMRRK